ncbi:AAA family ATPase [Nocardia nova]
MLLSFRVTNHRSLREEQQLLLTPTYPDDLAEEATWDAVSVAGIFGANASGKSNVLHALGYMRDLVRGSLRDSDSTPGVQRYPFALDQTSREEPSVFVVDILVRNVRHTYGFAVDDSRIAEEWLYTYPHNRRRKVFDRHEDDFEWGDSVSQKLKKFAEGIEKNVLFLSVAGRFRVDETQATFEWFTKVRTHTPFPLGFYAEYSRRLGAGDLERLTTILRAADTGIESVELIEESSEQWAARLANRRTNSNSPKRKYLQLRHRGADGETFPLELRYQSLGTQALMELSVLALEALSVGSVLVVDEIDRSLHSFLTSQIIGLFKNAETNPLQAQLIFSSHDSALLGRIQGVEVLHRDHIWFTEKNDCGETDLFPISAFRPRREDNRERRYLAGRYGAVPIVKDELFEVALASRGEVLNAE